MIKYRGSGDGKNTVLSILRREGLFLDFVSFVNNPDGSPRYENTVQYAILKREWL